MVIYLGNLFTVFFLSFTYFWKQSSHRLPCSFDDSTKANGCSVNIKSPAFIDEAVFLYLFFISMAVRLTCTSWKNLINLFILSRTSLWPKDWGMSVLRVKRRYELAKYLRILHWHRYLPFYIYQKLILVTLYFVKKRPLP